MASRWGYLLTLACLLSGCGYFQGASTDPDNEFADLELDEDTSRVLKVSKSDKHENTEGPSLGSSEPESPAKGELGLRLAVGDRFPLQKTVEQRLTQPTDQGMSTGHSRLDLLLSLTVEELRDGQTRFAVQYHRVRYLEQDPEGHTIEYNSMTPPRDIPAQARMYAGLVDNGFSFWIGPDNRLIDVVGFKDFVQRCVREVPVAQRQAVVDQLSADKGENGIASFIDDSIGLLPISHDPASSRVAVQEGTSWDLPARRLEGPVPLMINAKCKIKGLTERTAEIDLFGQISPASETTRKVSVAVRGGRCMGSCTVDRTTGLPTQSRIERYVDMVIELPDGTQVPQQKAVITTISAFLNQEAGAIRPASFSDETTPATGSESPAEKRPRAGTDELRLFR